MKPFSRRIRQGLAPVMAIALLGLLLPFTGAARADHGVTLDVEAEIQRYNVQTRRNGSGNLIGDAAILTANISQPALRRTFIDFENESGPNDPDTPDSDSYQTPDRSCIIEIGSLSCTVTYDTNIVTVGDTATVHDVWRAWIDHDQTGTAASNNGNVTTEADREEGRDEDAEPGDSPPALVTGCPAEGEVEPDCTDVVEVQVGGLEAVPDVQTVDAGTTARVRVRLFGPARQEQEIDFENESGGPNDPDNGTSRQTPDATCTIPVGTNECFFDYAHIRGSSTWRAWIDADRVESTVEADTTEGRFAGFYDCTQDEDIALDNCEPGIPVPDPGDGCDFQPQQGDEPDPREPDCTDVLSVGSRSGPVAMVDCDDQSGAEGQDTERETNPTRPSNQQQNVPDPSTERYRCQTFDQFGNPTGPGIQVKGENKSGINDPDRNGAVYTSVDYSCSTTFDEDDFFASDENTCYIEVHQVEGELGTAEICFYVGTASEGQAVCEDEPTGENQLANQSDAPNDLADQVEKTWENPSTFRLDCAPETDTNPAGTEHTVTCTATSSSGAPVGGVQVDAEATGTNDPDTSNTPQVTPDFSCETGTDGTCSFTHRGNAEGTTTYRAWIDTDNEDATSEADTGEGRDETVTPGARPEPDNTDVVEKLWTPGPATVAMTPESDTAVVGECNPYTITVTDENGAPVQGAILDVEQRHATAENEAANDEPTVSFCEPPASAGANPSGVDESKGDGGGPGESESPDNEGTAGGETSQPTDQNGKVTIGIRVAPGNGSNGAGGVVVTAFFESTDNDDPDANDPKDSSTKNWTPGSGEPGVPAGVALTPTSSTNEPGENSTYVATVSDGNGDPVEGANVTWTEEGQGEFVSQEATTDENGQAQAVVSSTQEGDQTITATTEECGAGFTCSDSSTQTWANNACPGFENDPRNQVVGTSGNDTLRGTDGNDIICGLGGKDTLIGDSGNDLLLGGGANDILRGNGGADDLRSGAGEDTLAGGGGNDKMKGQSDDDILSGGGGNDAMRGNGGKDVIRGRGGNDSLFGNGGRDSLNGGRGDDRIDGGAGRDTCVAGGGRDRITRCE